MKRVFIALASLLAFTVLVFAAYGVYFLISLVIHINATADTLPEEMKLAKQAGIKTDPSHFQQPLPPAKLNAAVVYDQLTILLRKRPLTSNQMVALSRLNDPYRTSAEANLACETALRRGDIMRLVYEAVAKPDCVFKKNWTEAIDLHFSELKTMQTTSYMIRAESLALERKGEWKQAIRTQSMGFTLAWDAGMDQTLIALMMESSLDYNTLLGMQDILQRYANNPSAVRIIHNTVSNRIRNLDLKRAVQSEIIMDISIAEILKEGDLSSHVDKLQRDMYPFSKLGRLADANLATLLKEMIPLYQATCLKPPGRTKVIDSVVNGINSDMNLAFKTKDVTWLLGIYLLPIPNELKVVGDRAFTERNILLASTAALEYHSTHGFFPDNLDKIAPETLHPVIGNPVTYRYTKNGFVVTGMRKPLDIHKAKLIFKYP